MAGPLAAQTATVRSAATLIMPGAVDSNSPAYWRDGELHIVNSWGAPGLAIAASQMLFDEADLEPFPVDGDHFPLWIESLWQDDDGTLYGWYHHEPQGVCPGTSLTAPQIGAVVSHDGGQSYTDLGIVMSAADPPDCSAENGFFAGGHGDFSVIPDRERAYFYFLFGNYGGDVSGQGVAIARMAFTDRGNPVGALWKYFEGDWNQPGLGGLVSPTFPARVAWQRADADALWGPSVHWNTWLQMYVALLNRSCCSPGWPEEGVYISFNPDLGNPRGWSDPQRILGGDQIDSWPAWYPQVLGLEPGETDTLAGEVARLYVKGVSHWEIVFERTGP